MKRENEGTAGVIGVTRVGAGSRAVDNDEASLACELSRMPMGWRQRSGIEVQIDLKAKCI